MTAVLILLTEGRAVLLTEEDDAGVTRTTVLLDGSSVCPAGVEDIPAGAGTAFSLVTRIPSVRSAEHREKKPFSPTVSF